MKPTGQSTKRCALYTRKSSEEGLDQDFNSLDAQREACASYVQSQRAEGWKALPDFYDDGGFSGGSMERPALKRLLADIAAGRIDIVVVYKIDRLTRSLADFARMVEVLERHQVSFVSVTQAFNTTTSMGRLTLNVLLSFAQFEREVTSERIRDKIAASKAKGMWMGGAVPLGYDPAPGGARTLTINESEAALVRRIFQTYLELGSVHALKDQLKTCGTRSKINVTAKGRTRGGVFFSRGSLFHLLHNRLYRGEITHKGKVHPGLHTAIIDEEIFDAVQLKLSSQTRRIKASNDTVAHSPLTGRIFDADGNPMSPTSAYGRHGTLYRYYVSAPLQQGTKRPLRDDQPRRVSASALEQQLTERLTVLLPDEASNKILDLILRLTVRSTSVTINLSLEHLSLIQNRLLHGESVSSEPHNTNGAHLTLPWHLSTKSGKTEITTGQRQSRQADPVLIRALRKAHALLHRDNSGLPMLDTAPDTPHRYRIIRLAFLAPDIQQAILAGRQPREMTLASLLDGKFPIVWADQRKMLGMDLQHR